MQPSKSVQAGELPELDVQEGRLEIWNTWSCFRAVLVLFSLCVFGIACGHGKPSGPLTCKDGHLL